MDMNPSSRNATPPRVIFLISPNFGLLDSWLPALWELRKRRPDVWITALFPKADIVAEIEPAEAMTQLGESVFNEVVFRSRAGFWVRAKSLAHAKELSGKFRIAHRIIGNMRAVLQRVGTFAATGSMIAFFDAAIRHMMAALTGQTYVGFDEVDQNVKAICFDLHAKTKKDCRDILARFPNTPRFSLLHGLAVADYEIKRGDYDAGHRTYRTTAYLFSKYERAAYARNYGLADAEMKVVGVPRHDPLWIETVLHHSKSDVPASWGKYIFVISRPALGDFFPKGKKREALQHIRRLAHELNRTVIVRLHPTERTHADGLYEEVFGKEAYGMQWIYSSSHPFVLGRNSLFAVTFYSGVAVDMLALGVPTIQMVDLVSRGKTGAIVEYKKMGLVLGADSYEELKAHALRIIKDKDAVIRQLKPNYDKFFRPIGKPACIIADDISKVL